MNDNSVITIEAIIGILLSVILGLFFDRFFSSLFDSSRYSINSLIFLIFFWVAVYHFYKVYYKQSLEKRTTLNPITSFDQIVMILCAIGTVIFFFLLGILGAAFFYGMTNDDSIPKTGLNIPVTSYPVTKSTPVSVNPINAVCGLTLNKGGYIAGETITLEYEGSTSYANDAWIGMFRADYMHGNEADAGKHDLTYRYIGKNTNGKLTFTAPSQSGEYDFRVFNTDTCCNGKETCTIKFIVTGGTDKRILKTDCGLTLDKEIYTFGETINIEYRGSPLNADNAWIGMFPASYNHGNEDDAGRYDLAYQYIGKKTYGELAFKAPSKAGEYDIRMFSTDTCCSGEEICYCLFNVR